MNAFVSTKLMKYLIHFKLTLPIGEANAVYGPRLTQLLRVTASLYATCLAWLFGRRWGIILVLPGCYELRHRCFMIPVLPGCYDVVAVRSPSYMVVTGYGMFGRRWGIIPVLPGCYGLRHRRFVIPVLPGCYAVVVVRSPSLQPTNIDASLSRSKKNTSSSTSH